MTAMTLRLFMITGRGSLYTGPIKRRFPVGIHVPHKALPLWNSYLGDQGERRIGILYPPRRVIQSLIVRHSRFSAMLK